MTFQELRDFFDTKCLTSPLDSTRDRIPGTTSLTLFFFFFSRMQPWVGGRGVGNGGRHFQQVGSPGGRRGTCDFDVACMTSA